MKVKFFLPESQDLVDPHFNFLKDSYGPDRVGLESDVYAHEIFPKPNFDGILVTKSNIKPNIEKRIYDAGGIHRHLRLPKKYPIMGDCGAFQFIKEKKPPYSCQEICDYYEKLGFDYGVTLDHVIVEFDLAYDESNALFLLEPTEDMKFRYQLSLKNAKEMLKIVKRRNARFKPIGCVQGWSPKSYHSGVKELINAGFDYIAIGGVARASNNVIISVLEEIRETVIKANVKLHVLGVIRMNIIDEYLKSNVISGDSASSIMQAFKSNKDNYHMPNKKYTAVRIPAVNGDASPKVRKLLAEYAKSNGEGGIDKEKKRLARLEKAALSSVRAYAKRKISLKAAMKDLIKYENQFKGEKRYYSLFEETLRDRPWEKCHCTICQNIGVEAIILRGNNRNRRRAFHNTYIFYNEFKKWAGKK